MKCMRKILPLSSQNKNTVKTGKSSVQGQNQDFLFKGANLGFNKNWGGLFGLNKNLRIKKFRLQ